MNKTVTMHLELELEVSADYTPEEPMRYPSKNCECGDPGCPAEIDITSVILRCEKTYKNKKIVKLTEISDYLNEEQIEQLEENYLENM